MMKYIWKKQTEKNNCGIIAVSIIANCSIKKASEAIGKTGYTDTIDLHKGLKKLGFKTPKRLLSFKKNIPSLAIAKLSFPYTHHWHWVVIYKKKIFDGIFGDKRGHVNWQQNWKITSYLPIENE